MSTVNVRKLLLKILTDINVSFHQVGNCAYSRITYANSCALMGIFPPKRFCLLRMIDHAIGILATLAPAIKQSKIEPGNGQEMASSALFLHKV